MTDHDSRPNTTPGRIESVPLPEYMAILPPGGLIRTAIYDIRQELRRRRRERRYLFWLQVQGWAQNAHDRIDRQEEFADAAREARKRGDKHAHHLHATQACRFCDPENSWSVKTDEHGTTWQGKRRDAEPAVQPTPAELDAVLTRSSLESLNQRLDAITRRLDAADGTSS